MSQSMHEGAALAIGLDDEADAVPAGKLRVEAERLQDVERELEPVRLLGVDVEADVVGLAPAAPAPSRAAAARP